MQGAGAAHATHHFVQDQQDAVAIADLADAFEISRRRGHRAECRADHRLGDECGDVVWPESLDFGFQLVGHAQAIRLRRLVGTLAAVGITLADMRDVVEQQRRKLRPPPAVATRRQSAEGVAVVTLPARDDAIFFRPATFSVVLHGHLQRGLDTF